MSSSALMSKTTAPAPWMTSSDPALCRPCTPAGNCLNTCERCEICLGKPTIPQDCFPGYRWKRRHGRRRHGRRRRRSAVPGWKAGLRSTRRSGLSCWGLLPDRLLHRNRRAVVEPNTSSFHVSLLASHHAQRAPREQHLAQRIRTMQVRDTCPQWIPQLGFAGV